MDKEKLKLALHRYLPPIGGLLIIVSIISVITLGISPMIKYSRANGFLDQERYEEAIALFKELDDYEDSKTLLARAELLYAYQQGYDITSGDSTEAIAEGDLENSYLRAKSYITNKKYAKAAEILRQLGDYKDSKELLEPYRYHGLDAGDTIVFGSYEQDGNSVNGKEDLSWTVASADDRRMLIICDSVIECMPYGKDICNWANSSLRSFLNGDFYEEAFTAEEKSFISKEATKTAANPEYGSGIDGICTDYVIIPDIDQIRTLAGKAPDKKSAPPTPYAKSKGLHEYSKTVKVDGEELIRYGAWFWLRNAGFTSAQAAVCYSDGDVSLGGQSVGVSLGVRPAIYIDLDIQ